MYMKIVRNFREKTRNEHIDIIMIKNTLTQSSSENHEPE